MLDCFRRSCQLRLGSCLSIAWMALLLGGIVACGSKDEGAEVREVLQHYDALAESDIGAERRARLTAFSRLHPDSERAQAMVSACTEMHEKLLFVEERQESARQKVEMFERVQSDELRAELDALLAEMRTGLEDLRDSRATCERAERDLRARVGGAS